MKGHELERIQTKADGVIAGEIADNHNDEQEKELYFLLGGLDALNTVANNLNAAVIINLQRIRDEQLYLASGYDRFDDFMDKHPRATMSYKRFNYVEGVFKNLGNQVFDLLNGSGLSMRQQKLLGKGNVEIEDGRVLVHFDGDVVEEYDINNRRQWMESLKALADSHAEKNIKLARQKEQIDKHADEKRKLYDDIDRIKAAKIAETASQPHMVARVELGIAFRKLTEAAAALKPVEKDQFRDQVLEDVAAWRAGLMAAYATERKAETRPVGSVSPEVSDEDWFEAKLATVDLEDLDNETELAQQL